jgi:class 3 adenylate cyclase/tetratricopeptide (TPR) repeat protein
VICPGGDFLFFSEASKMKCPSCQFENPDGIIFCGKCASKFELICPKCNFSNPPDFIFCGKCAHNLSTPSEAPPKDLSFEEKLTKIQRYLPKGLTEKILSQKDRIEGERKQVTVMFADMEGFTSLSERLGPEEAYTIMDQVYEILIHKVHDYEGTVNEMTGDGIMALFGAPIALEDAPQRAIRSAYAIHREIARFNGRTKQEKENIPPLKMRIGIHTGPVVVGTLGNDLRVEFKAVGDTVNLASRIEGLAEPGATYVSDETFKLTEGLFRFEALGEHLIKGIAEKVKAYRVIAPSTSRTRFDVSAERGLTPFVGRERELELLLDGFERSKAGRGQAFSIIAEAGVGKSRLLYEFRKAVSNEDVTFQEGKCLSYSQGVAYHPVIDIVKANFDIVEGDGDLEIREKLKRGLNILSADESSIMPYLLELLSVKDSGVDSISLSPEARKDRIIEAINRITIKASQIRPLVVAIEDLHWIDKSSEDYLKALLDNVSGERVFLIFTYRPEYVHTWSAKSYHSQVNLNRLSNRESLAMVTHLLGTENIGDELEELILEKTDGVPFFIEEFLKSLQDLKIIERTDSTFHLAKELHEVTIPSTIHDVIMARVDTLSEDVKEVLQIGSVIEREFSYDLIKQVVDLSEQELLSRLSVLKDSELLYERGIYPKSTYIFKHALTRQVVYDSILAKRKMKLHGEIGNAIEELHKDNIIEHYEVLAEHYITSEDHEKGAEYSRLAAKKTVRTASFIDAFAYGEKRIFCLEKLPVSADVQKKIIDARVGLGLFYIQLNYHLEAKEAVEPVAELALEYNNKKRLSQIYTIIGTNSFMVEEDYPKALKYLENARYITEELNDNISVSMANYWLGFCFSHKCEYEKALHFIGKSLEINVAANTLWGISVLKSIISHWIYTVQGRIDLAYQISNQALQIAEESGDIYSKAFAQSYHGYASYCKGFLDEAERNLLKATELCERINYFIMEAQAQRFLGDTYFDMRKYQKSQDAYKKAVSLSENLGVMPSYINFYKISLAKTKVMNNERDFDFESLYGYVRENNLKIFEGCMIRRIGRILVHINDKHITDAEDWIKKAIEADKKNSMMWSLGRDYAIYAELLVRKGDQSKAEVTLKKAIKILKECGADGWVDKYKKELSEL